MSKLISQEAAQLESVANEMFEYSDAFEMTGNQKHADGLRLWANTIRYVVKEISDMECRQLKERLESDVEAFYKTFRPRPQTLPRNTQH